MCSKLLGKTLLAACLLAGCAQSDLGTPPPKDGFYYPISVAALERPDSAPVLYVVNSNFDLRYNRGTVLAVDLAKLGTISGRMPVNTAVDPDVGHVSIDHFGGEALLYTPRTRTGTEQRLFVTTRYEHTLYSLNVDGPKIACADGGQDCLGQGMKMEDPEDADRRMVDPFGMALDGEDLWVGHLHVSDNPPDTGKDRVSYLARLNAERFDSLKLFDIGLAAVQGVVRGPMGLYLAGRTLTGTEATQSMAVRFVPIVDQAPRATGDHSIENQDVVTGETSVYEARGVALSSDRNRLFVTTRSPAGLMVLDVTPEITTGEYVRPRNTILGFRLLPSGPSAMTVIARPGRRDLVAVSCTGSDAVAFYDDDLGEIAGLVSGIQEPYGMAQVALPGNVAGRRLFVVSFGNHTVDVVDIPDLSRPRTALITGQLGYGAHRPMGVDLPGSNP
jgi:DNA-binding beta-propeller fold protein YncE